MAEAFVQLAADGAGKRVRNVTAEVLQADGTVATVYMQVIALADETGATLTIGRAMPVQDQQAREMLAEILEILRVLALKLEA